MEELSALIAVLFVIGLITLFGHGIWVLLAMIYRALIGESEQPSILSDDNSATRTSHGARCAECGAILRPDDSFCSVCGRGRFGARPMADLAMTERQLDKFLNQGRLDAETHKLVMALVEEERARLIGPVRREREPEPHAPPPAPVEPATQPPPPPVLVETPVPAASEIAAALADSKDVPAVAAETPRQPRRSFTEMLETFMEESSIRWGELVGGLLIIGCSIALVVRIWSEIVARPSLQFSVFIGVLRRFSGLVSTARIVGNCPRRAGAR